EDPGFVEGNAALGGEVARNVGPLGYLGGEGGKRGVTLVRAGEGAWEGVGHARPDLEQREIDISQRSADGMRRSGGIGSESPLEIAEIFGSAMDEEGGGAGLRLLLLILVVEIGRDRMMRIVSFGDEVRDRQLQSMREEAQIFVPGGKLQLRPEVVENIG